MADVNRYFEVTFDPDDGPVTLTVSSGNATSGTMRVRYAKKPASQFTLLKKFKVDEGDVVISMPAEGQALADIVLVNLGRYRPRPSGSRITIYQVFTQQERKLPVVPDPTIDLGVPANTETEVVDTFEFVPGKLP